MKLNGEDFGPGEIEAIKSALDYLIVEQKREEQKIGYVTESILLSNLKSARDKMRMVNQR